MALLKPRETLPESEWSTLLAEGGRQRSFSLSAAFPLVPSAGSNQETEVREKLTGSFFLARQQRNKLPERSRPSFSQIPVKLSRGQVAGGSSVQRRTKVGNVNEMLQPHPSTFVDLRKWTIPSVFGTNLLWDDFPQKCEFKNRRTSLVPKKITVFKNSLRVSQWENGVWPTRVYGLITNKENVFFQPSENTFLKFFEISPSQVTHCSKYLAKLRILWWTAALLVRPS